MPPGPEQTRTPEPPPKRRRKLRWEKAFLTELARAGNVSAACLAAAIGRTTAYDHAERHPDFEAAWKEALETACDRLELEAFRRAHDGADEPIVYKGELSGVWVDTDGNRVPEPLPSVAAPPPAANAEATDAPPPTPPAPPAPDARFVPLTIKRYSDALLMFLLKAHRPDKFRERSELHARLQAIEERLNKDKPK